MGLHWYQDAHIYLKAMASHFNKPLDMICGMVTVTSPQIPWQSNLNVVHHILKHKGKLLTGFKTNCYPLNIKKACQMYRTKKVFPYLNGPKVTAFYYNLKKPDDKKRVTIDTFMISAWNQVINKNDFKTKWHNEQYTKPLEIIIRRLAKKYNILPLQYQAIIWITYHRIIKSLSSYSGQLNLKIF
jgi:hypothetical protein